jgi:hypothetical protein
MGKPKYTKEQINSAIRFLKIQEPPIAEIQYVHTFKDTIGKDDGELVLYDYMSSTHLTISQLFASAKDSGWEC